MSDLERASRPDGLSGRLRRALLLAVALAAVVLLLAWAFGPPSLSGFWASVGRSKRRAAVVVFLNGVLAGYVVAWLVLVAAALAFGGWVAAGRPPLRGVAKRRMFGLALVGLATATGLSGIEAGAAAWRAWLRRGATASASTIPAPRPADESEGLEAVRIVVIGESSARGEPYNPWLSIGQMVGWGLESALAGRRVEVDVRATGGATLESAQGQLAEVDYRPDLLILVSGHNEFQARYAWSRNPAYYKDEIAARPERTLLEPALGRSPFCRLVMETLDRQRVDLVPEAVVTRQLVDRPTCTADEAEAIRADFERRLDEVASYAEAIGAQAAFVIPASNDGGFEPSRSYLPAETPLAGRLAFAARFKQVRESESSDLAAAFAGYRELLRLHPGFAEAHFRLAGLLRRTGRFDQAREHYIAAREADGMPLRCPQPFRDAYHAVAARHPGLIVLDGSQVLEKQVADGILDDRLFHDAQHPTFRGYLALAQALLDSLHERRALGRPSATPTPKLDPDAAARHFGLDTARWAEVCRRSALFYEACAYIRHDPAGRLEHRLRYREAARTIKRGAAPEEAGVTGLGVHPASGGIPDLREK